jgi:hypothetical protein
VHPQVIGSVTGATRNSSRSISNDSHIPLLSRSAIRVITAAN